MDSAQFAAVAGMNLCVLRSSAHHFGYRRTIHIWLRPGDYRNANLMILLAYILAGHREWKDAEIRLFATFGHEEMEQGIKRLTALIAQDRIPISRNKVRWLPLPPEREFDTLVTEHSAEADLVITGFSLEKLTQDSGAFMQGFDGIADLLFVRAGQRILITDSPDESPPPQA